MKKIIAISAAAVCFIGGIFAISAVSAHKSLDKITKGESAIYSDEWADLIGELLYAKYAGDESASKEELEKLNKRNGAAYDECMVISADIYSHEKQAVLRDTKWQLAKENGSWKVVDYSAS